MVWQIEVCNGGKRVDHNVIKSSLQEIIEIKKIALVNLSRNFTEVIIKANKVNPENLVASVNFEKFTSINLWSNQSQPSINLTVIGCSIVLWI